MCLLAIEEIKDQVPEEPLVAASSVIFPVQNLHIKMMRIKNTVCNQFYNFSSCLEEEHGECEWVRRHRFARRCAW
jgi:hypothetical protein